MSVKVLALDLERTLISDAMSAIPRPGLFDFMVFCNSRFERVVMFTSVEEAEAREILAQLAHSGHVPPEFLLQLEYVEWSGEYKDLNFVRNSDAGEVILVDDDPGWVRPDQRDRWVAIAAWDGGEDSELPRLQTVLDRWLDSRASSEA